MAIRVGINGFGRIGRLVFRAICDEGLLGKEIEVVAVNDIVPADNLAYLVKYDSTQGKFPGTVCSEKSEPERGRRRRAGGQRPEDQVPGRQGRPGGAALEDRWAWTSWSSPPACSPTPPRPRATSRPAPRRSSSPPRPRTKTSPIVMGVNDQKYDPAKHNIISNASCTTNCLAPVVHVLLKEGFGIEEGLMTTIHSYTATQKTVDGPSKKDWKGGRTAADQHHSFHDRRGQGRGLAIPEVKGKLTGMSFRVPTPTVSVVDLTVRTVKDTSYEEICAAMKKASQTYLKGILGYTDDEVVSSDFIHDAHSSIFDAGSGIELNKRFFKLVSWYDNEWGYYCRCVDLIQKVGKKL